MDHESANNSSSISLFSAVLIALSTLVSIVILWWLSDPIPQDLRYHEFADQRAMIGVPHAHNVLSNLPFCLFGLLGAYQILTLRRPIPILNLMYGTFFIAVFLTGLGSMHYHLNPANETLFWDRLPMAIAFMSIFSAILYETVNPKLARILFPWLVLVGMASTVYWHLFDDLRAYALVQYGSLLLLSIMLLRNPPALSGWLFLALGCYVIAKFFEAADVLLHEISAQLSSGHALKHLVAAVAPIIVMLRLRDSRWQAFAEGLENNFRQQGSN